MPRYHILYKENPKEFYSKGRNIDADSPITALTVFENFQINHQMGKDTVFLGMWDIDALAGNTLNLKIKPDSTG